MITGVGHVITVGRAACRSVDAAAVGAAGESSDASRPCIVAVGAPSVNTSSVSAGVGAISGRAVGRIVLGRAAVVGVRRGGVLVGGRGGGADTFHTGAQPAPSSAGTPVCGGG